jgi:hypothetical protein
MIMKSMDPEPEVASYDCERNKLKSVHADLRLKVTCEWELPKNVMVMEGQHT